jgi:ribose transport system substrate-binding protein
MFSRTRLLFVVGLGLLSALALAACGGGKEGTEESATAAGGGCKPSKSVETAYDKAWEQGEEAFELTNVEIPKTELCEVDTSQWKKEEPSGGYKIAFAAQGPTNSWAAENEEAFKTKADELGVEELYASADGDATKQVDNIQQLASQEPDAMVVVPMGSSITGQVKAATAQGIPVVACAGTIAPSSGVVSTVTRSYELQGRLWAEWIAKQIGGKGRIAMISGIAGVPTAEYPKKAAEELFAEKYPEIEIVTKQYDDWSPTKAKTVAASLVGKNLDAIWSDSSFTALGVYEAYKEAGKPVPPVTGDASNAYLKAIQNADVKFALSPFPPEMSTQCLETAVSILKGEPVPNFVNVEAPAFTDKEKKKYVRPECSENLWVPTKLSDEELKSLKLCE